MVPVARLFVRAFLGSHPHARDAELIASEYVTNAVRHTASGEGGAVHVTVVAAPGGVRIEVTDHGSAAGPAPGAGPAAGPGAKHAGEYRGAVPPGATRPGGGVTGTWEDENGRGLLIVDSLAARWGHYGLGDGQVTAWAELGDPWDAQGGEAMA
jgi:anti-sigma regulatory factor (Ser/Thr protein kinase)